MSKKNIDESIFIQTFIENYPQFKKLSGTVSKHVTIVSELSRLVGLYRLLEVSETEQHLVCQGDHNEVVQVKSKFKQVKKIRIDFFSYLQKIKRLIKDEKIRDIDIVRLLALYELRYERHASNEFNALKYEAQKSRRLSEKYNHVSFRFHNYQQVVYRHVSRPMS